MKSLYFNDQVSSLRTSGCSHLSLCVRLPGYGFNSIQNYFSSDYRNLIDLVRSGSDAWKNESIILMHPSCMGQMDGQETGLAWNWMCSCMKFRILLREHPRDFMGHLLIDFGEMQTSKGNFPRENPYYFKDWFYPIYSNNGGAWVLNNYFNLLAKYFPERTNNWQYDGRTISLDMLFKKNYYDKVCHNYHGNQTQETILTGLQKLKNLYTHLLQALVVFWPYILVLSSPIISLMTFLGLILFNMVQ